MRNIIKYISLVLLVFTTNSCDGFLQKDHPSNPSESIFWQHKSDFEQALTACYSVVYDYPGVLSQIISCYDNLTDNALSYSDGSEFGGTNAIVLGNVTPTSSGFISSNWYMSFKAISRCNLFLEKINGYNGGDISSSEKLSMIAQAKALRGYYYHWLYFCYKEFPLFTDFLSLDKQYLPKATRKQIYEQIMRDFSEAAEALPDETYMQSPGRFTKGACYAFMSKVAMFESYSDENGIPTGVAKPEIMRKVVQWCDKVKGYTLDEDLRMAFVESKQMKSQEMIFSVRYAAPNITNSINILFGRWTEVMVQRNLIDAFECVDGLPWGISSLTEKVDESVLNSKTLDKNIINEERLKLFKDRDKRFLNSITIEQMYNFPEQANYPDNPITFEEGTSLTGFRILRLIQPFEQGKTPEAVICGTDVNLMRYAHVLLMLAEAENEAEGPTQKAYDAINKVRLRAGQPELPKGLTQEQFRDRVRKEWRYETPFEGWRYFQLKQWNLLKNIPEIIKKEPRYSIAAKYESAFMFWPIPQSEIDKANGILVQDPNYK